MKRIVISTRKYEKSYKRVAHSGVLKKRVQEKLNGAIDILSLGKKLPLEYQDHQLTGEFKEYRECHIKGDLLLVYQIREKELILVLIDIGAHSYLGL